jgi:type VI secretion system protein VasG
MSDIKALIGKLNPVCKRALETAAERCLSQTHFSVEIEHLLIQLIELPDGDVPCLLLYYEIVPAQVSAQLNQALERLKRGNNPHPGAVASSVGVGAGGLGLRVTAFATAERAVRGAACRTLRG